MQVKTICERNISVKERTRITQMKEKEKQRCTADIEIFIFLEGYILLTFRKQLSKSCITV